MYVRCVTRTNIDIDEVACSEVMRFYGLPTKRAAVNLALRELAVHATVEEARQMKGSGWEGELDDLRAAREPAAPDRSQ